MSTELVRGRDARGALPASFTIASGRNHTAGTILRAWFEGKSEHTKRSYQPDLEDFALYFLACRTLFIDACADRP